MFCCVCLIETTDGISIFDEAGTESKIAEVVHQHLWFEPKPNEELLSYICHTCWGAISEFHVFYLQAEKAHAEHQTRKEHLVIKLETDEEVYLHETVQYKNENAEHTKQDDDVKEEDLQENPLAENHIKETEVDKILGKDNETCSANAQRNPLDDEDDESDIDCISDEYEPSGKSENESCSEDEKIQKVKKPKEKKSKNVEKKTRKRKSSNNSETTKDDKPKRKKSNRFHIDYAHAEQMIQKHIPMACNLCDFVGKAFADIKAHFRESHPQLRPYVTCCDKQFTKRFYVAQHALKHEDPNCFRCHSCNRSFTTNRGLTMHNLNYHATEEERTFCCDLCPKKFATSNLLDLHKPSHIPKDQWKFFCTQCPEPKAFASEYLMSVHVNARHKRATNVCHVCAKEIRDKNAFEKHVSRHIDDSGPRLPCPYPDCDSWLKDEDNLKKHLRRRHNPEQIEYKCTKCEKVCNNRGALTNHMNYSHSNNGQMFHCEQCDKTFKRALSLKEHMTQHTGETLYTCPFCPRTFNSNANMYAHKKRNHPVEWEESRKSKQGYYVQAPLPNNSLLN